jgi:hypothetical protein
VKEVLEIKEDWRVLFSIKYAYGVNADEKSPRSEFENILEKKLNKDEKFNKDYLSIHSFSIY